MKEARELAQKEQQELKEEQVKIREQKAKLLKLNKNKGFKNRQEKMQDSIL